MVSSLQNYTIFATVGLGFLTASMLQVACMLTVSPPVKIGVEFTIEPNHPYYFSQQ